VFYHLHNQVALALQYREGASDEDIEEIRAEAEEICLRFFESLPQVGSYVETDMQAAFDGDPAAGSKEEILLAYPGLLASTVNRLAHELYRLGVPLVPRMMTEYAHSLTGIDIHPGAKLGRYFFIDHGTGIVIGESTIVGDHVKLYQGVTLGALSTRGGQTLKSLKRHPTIEDNVTIYSGASILGGNTVIGHDSVIGGNVFITKSVPANTRVSVKNQELVSRTTTGKGVQREELTQNEVWYYVI
jgi:serine O-acetyltransferase